jgi:hypothetical protein
MDSIQKALMESFNPVVSVEIKDIGQGKRSEVILKQVHHTLSKNHKVHIDRENSVIYIGK